MEAMLCPILVRSGTGKVSGRSLLEVFQSRHPPEECAVHVLLCHDLTVGCCLCLMIRLVSCGFAGPGREVGEKLLTLGLLKISLL
jgi:hypothetical protein